MIYIETSVLKEHKEYDEMKTVVQIEGDGETVKEEIKTLLDYCKQNDDLRNIVIVAIEEVLHDN